MLNCLAVSAQALTDITVQKVWMDKPLYSMVISEISGSTEMVVKNYVPVYDLMTNTYGLFDTKNNEFLSGTGSFSGPAI